MEYGNVQRGMLGIQGGELNSAVAKEVGVADTQGFYVNSVVDKSGADRAGIKKGDIVKKIDDRPINNFADLNGAIVTKRPNDVVQVTVARNGKDVVLPVKLTKNEINSFKYQGLELEDLTAAEKKTLKINYGVRVKDVNDGEFMQYADYIKNGIILSINNTKATDINTVTEILSRKGQGDRVRVELLTQNGEVLRFLL